MKKNTLYAIFGFFAILILLIVIPSIVKRMTPGIVDKISLGENEKVAFASLNQSQKLIYYFNEKNSTLKKYDIKKKTSQDIVKLNLNNIVNINYSPDFSKAIVQTFNPKKGLAANWLFLLDSGQKSPMNNQIGELAFSPEGDKIAYRFTDWDANLNQVMISDVNGENSKKITDIDFGFEGIGIGWLSQEEIYYYPLATEAATVPVYVININTLAKQNINKKKDFGSVRFFGDIGIAVLISENTGDFKIAQISKEGEKIATFNINTTVQKISLQDDNLFVASSQDGNGDDLFQIDLGSKKETKLIENSKDNYIISDIMIDPENNIIYFLSNKMIYQIRL